jgi:hypothetical protein
MLYNIDTKLHKIMHTLTTPFGNLDIIFCGDLCQAQHVLKLLDICETTEFWNFNIETRFLYILDRQCQIF